MGENMFIAFTVQKNRLILEDNTLNTLKILYNSIKKASPWFSEKQVTVWEKDPVSYMDEEEKIWPEGSNENSKLIISHGIAKFDSLILKTTVYVDPENIMKDIPLLFITFNYPMFKDVEPLKLLYSIKDPLFKTADSLWKALQDYELTNARLIISDNLDALINLFVPRLYQLDSSEKHFGKTLAETIVKTFQKKKKRVIPLERLVSLEDKDLLEVRDYIILHKFCQDLLGLKLDKKTTFIQKFFSHAQNITFTQGSIILKGKEIDGIQEQITNLSRAILAVYKDMFIPKDKLVKKAAKTILKGVEY